MVNLLLGMGYGGSAENAGRTVGRSGDDGVDGVIDQDALGEQARRRGSLTFCDLVGVPRVRAAASYIDIYIVIGYRLPHGVTAPILVQCYRLSLRRSRFWL